MTKIKLLSILLVSSGAITAVAEDQTNDKDTITVFETIEVTAEKRLEPVQNIAASISVLSGDDIEDAGIESIVDVANQVPNLHITTWGGRRNNYVFMRGVGATYGEPAVGFYVDDVGYFNNAMFDIDLADVERIEILRGPQGTLYGLNALAGVINIVTRKPDNETEGKLSLGAGDFGLRELKGRVQMPLVKDKLFFGLSGVKTERDGFIDNLTLGKPVDDRDDLSARAQLRWLPNDKTDFNLSVDTEHLRGGAYPLGPLNELRKQPGQVSNDFAGGDERDTLGISLRANRQMSGVDVTSITAWREWENESFGDQDGTPLDIVPVLTLEDQSQISQEIRLASTDNTSQLEWLTGLYFYQEDFKEDTTQMFGADAVALGVMPMPMDSTLDAKKDNRGYALFGQLDHSLTDQLTLTAGLRWDRDERGIDLRTSFEAGGNTVPGTEATLVESRDFEKWLPKLALSYALTPLQQVYASVTRGYRSGGFNTLHPDPADASFDSETSSNYEIGLKGSGWQKRLSYSLALFRIELKDQQVLQLTPGFTSVVRNAGESHSQGLEAELNLRPAPNWDMSAGFSYTDTEFDVYSDPLLGQDYAGKNVPFAPATMTNLSVHHRHPLAHGNNLFAQLDWQRIGKFHWDVANILTQEDYDLLNLRLGIEGERWETYLWGKNLLEESYQTVVYDFPGLGPRAEPGDPRTYGLTVSLLF